MEKVWLKNYPKAVPHKIPQLKSTLVEEFERVCKDFGKKPAFLSMGKKLSYKGLYKKSQYLAKYLQDQGFKKNDRIAIQLPNLLQYPVALWGSFLAGLTVVNMNPLSRPREILLPLKETKAKGIFLLSDKLKELESLLDQTFLEHVIVSQPGDLLNFPKKSLINWYWQYQTRTLNPPSPPYQGGNFETAKPSHIKKGGDSKKKLSVDLSLALKQGKSQLAGKAFLSPHKEMEDLLLIQYTGGTTGVLKGVGLSQKNILSNLKQCEIWMRAYLKKGEEVALTALPLCHIFSFLVNGLVFFCSGYTSVLIANPKKINSLVAVLKKHKISVGTGLNSLFKACLQNKNFKKLDFSRWKLFISGGMALQNSVQKEWELCTQSLLVEGYGLTESSPVVSVGLLDRSSKGFVGYPLPSTEIRITDKQGQKLPFTQEGELEVRGPQVMKGYYNNKKETDKVLNPEGWLKTGDIAQVNEQGLIQILDRKKNMINISGFKVYPNEIEQVLLSHPQVSDCVVIGKKDKNHQEQVQAFVVKELTGLDQEQLLSYCKQNLAPYKIPKQIHFCDHLPKNFMGKALRPS